jgi:hypothetical protein
MQTVTIRPTDIKTHKNNLLKMLAHIEYKKGYKLWK